MKSIEPYDAAISKLARGELCNLQWVRAGLQTNLISLLMMRLRVRSTTILDGTEQAATFQGLVTLGAD